MTFQEPFDQPSAYSLQKSVGLQAMHALLVTVLEYVRSVGDSVIELSSYKKALTVSEFQSSELFSETALSSQPGCPETAFYGLGRRHEVPT